MNLMVPASALSILVNDVVVWHLTSLLFLIRTTWWPDIRNFLGVVLRPTPIITNYGSPCQDPIFRILILDPAKTSQMSWTERSRRRQPMGIGASRPASQ